MKTYHYPKLGLENLTLAECEEPKPAPREVVVRFHAASLNYRDLLFAAGLYNPRPNLPAVPLSDGAGEITAVGEGMTKWEVGDRVCPCLFPRLDRRPQDRGKGPLGAGRGRTRRRAAPEPAHFTRKGSFESRAISPTKRPPRCPAPP